MYVSHRYGGECLFFYRAAEFSEYSEFSDTGTRKKDSLRRFNVKV